MEELERRDKCSNSLLANVLDMDDDFLAGTGTDKVWFGNHNLKFTPKRSVSKLACYICIY
jgi:hypothetical protein